MFKRKRPAGAVTPEYINRIPMPVPKNNSDKPKIVEALEYIQGYCEKHTRCVDCKLYDDENNDCTICNRSPIDWDIVKMSKRSEAR